MVALTTDWAAVNAHMLRLFGAATPAPSDAEIDYGIEQGRVADAAGLWITDRGYVTTYDTDLAAASLADLYAARQAMAGRVTQWSSEGTTVQTSGADWAGLAAMWRAQSATFTVGAGWSWITLERDGVNDLDPRSAEFER